MEERRKVWEKVEGDYDFERPVAAVITHLTKLVEQYPGQTLRIEKDYYGYDGGCTYNIEVERLETDLEFNKRVTKLENDSKAELRLLANLIAKHPDVAITSVDKLREAKATMGKLDAAIHTAIAAVNNRIK